MKTFIYITQNKNLMCLKCIVIFSVVKLSNCDFHFIAVSGLTVWNSLPNSTDYLRNPMLSIDSLLLK